MGPYEIVAPLGAGGMGEVYSAKDTRLDRTVAIKVLASGLAGAADLRERFEREARTISSLNHPHICVLYDIGHQDGIDYIVMEFLDGETLAQRLAKGPLPLGQVLRYGVEIADALDKAHRQGIVHRDLKPANIMLTKSGAKLLDFGLAKLRAPQAAVGNVSLLPTQDPQLTAEGTILGTFQYMAPEQLEGKEADARTDIFAFGAVLYEMIARRKAFEGKTQASLIAQIMDQDPQPISAFQPLTPPALDRVIRTCLAKDPEERWQSAHDVHSQLKWIAESGSQTGVPFPVTARRRWGERIAWAAAMASLLVAGTFAALHLINQPLDRGLVRVSILPADNLTVRRLAVSPDGRRVVFVAVGEGGGKLWIRSLDSAKAEPLPGTEGAEWEPFWSPDSRYVGFFASGKLKKIEASGGAAQVLADARNPRGGTWNDEGDIVFAPNDSGPLFRVSAAGGDAKPLTKINENERELSHRFPSFLPDGRHFLYLSHFLEPDKRKLYIGSLDSDKLRPLFSHPSQARYAEPGYLLFVRQKVLLAQRFDADSFETRGEPITVAEDVGGRLGFGEADFSVSGNGVLAYGIDLENRLELTWFDRTGKKIGTVGPRAILRQPRLSPDGNRLAVERPDPQTGYNDLWLFDLVRSIQSRFTFDPAPEYFPTWSPDGAQIAYSSARGDKLGVLVRDSSGAGDERMILSGTNWTYPTDWSSDGRYIAFVQGGGATRWDVWALPVTTEKRTPVPLLRSAFNEFQARFSPNGRWIAYTSDESGKSEVYVQSFPSSGGKWQISTTGGSQASWRSDGQELFYLAPDGTMMALEVKQEAPTFGFGVPKPLFATGVRGGGSIFVPGYTVTSDGQRFLVNLPVEVVASNPIHLVLNWTKLVQ